MLYVQKAKISILQNIEPGVKMHAVYDKRARKSLHFWTPALSLEDWL